MYILNLKTHFNLMAQLTLIRQLRMYMHMLSETKYNGAKGMPNVALIEPEAEPVERRFFSKAETRVLNVVFEACAEVPAVAFPVRQLMLLSSTSRRTVQTTLAKAHAAGVIVRQKRPRMNGPHLASVISVRP